MGNGVCWADNRPSLEGCTALWPVSVTWVSADLPVNQLAAYPRSRSTHLLNQPVYCLSVSGESLEETVSREVAEEVGLEVYSVSYSSSQHWPFPHSSFMLSCHASVSPAHTQVNKQVIF